MNLLTTYLSVSLSHYFVESLSPCDSTNENKRLEDWRLKTNSRQTGKHAVPHVYLTSAGEWLGWLVKQNAAENIKQITKEQKEFQLISLLKRIANITESQWQLLLIHPWILENELFNKEFKTFKLSYCTPSLHVEIRSKMIEHELIFYI